MVISRVFSNSVILIQDFVCFTESSTSGGIHVVEKESGEETIEHGITHGNRATAFDIVSYYSRNQREYLGTDTRFFKTSMHHPVTLQLITNEHAVVTRIAYQFTRCHIK